jgi:diguanylate cyclase (GGDEF)-like protein
MRAQIAAIGTFSSIMCDIDHFKGINDGYGHDMGDRAIREVASTISNLGPIVGRLGGEEFAILLPGTQLAAAVSIAERLRAEMAALQFVVNKDIVTLTCSFGVSEWRDGETVDEVLKRADMALYAAKGAGRNRVIAADESFAVAGYEGANRPVRSSERQQEAESLAANASTVTKRMPLSAA